MDTKHHLIAAHYVTNNPIDRAQLCDIGKQAQTALRHKELTVLADRGYYSGQKIKESQDEGMTPIVPKTDTSGQAKKGLFSKADFHYDAEKDAYLCPNNQELQNRFSTVEREIRVIKYFSNLACRECKIKSQCTRSKGPRRISRWEHEDRLELMETTLQSKSDSMAIRKQTVEHPYGTIKSWMGATHFLTKRLHNVSTEMSLHVLAYNLKRMISIIGQHALIEAIRA